MLTNQTANEFELKQDKRGIMKPTCPARARAFIRELPTVTIFDPVEGRLPSRLREQIDSSHTVTRSAAKDKAA
jgi:hypothetical protein